MQQTTEIKRPFSGILNYWLTAQACSGKNVVRLTDRLDMAEAVDWDVKPHVKQTFGLKSCLFRKRLKADVFCCDWRAPPPPTGVGVCAPLIPENNA